LHVVRAATTCKGAVGEGHVTMGRWIGSLVAIFGVAGCVTDGSSLGGLSSPSQPDMGWGSPVGDPFHRGVGSPFVTPFGGGGSGGRTFQPAWGVVCDRVTETCYRGRQIDASETRGNFGRGAAREVDRIRDAQGTNRIYRPSDNVVCNRLEQICFKNGHPDVSETRDYFGKKASRKID
jgi:hypothetical protein